MPLPITKLTSMLKGSADPLTSAFGFAASWVLMADEPYKQLMVWLEAQDPLKGLVAIVLVIICLRAFKSKTIALVEEVLPPNL
jgi:hypothetical protein